MMTKLTDQQAAIAAAAYRLGFNACLCKVEKTLKVPDACENSQAINAIGELDESAELFFEIDDMRKALKEGE